MTERAVEAYNPDQPRVPAGSPEGGEWTTDGGAAPFSLDMTENDYGAIAGHTEKLTDHTGGEATLSKARYAKGMIAVRINDGGGMKSRAERIMDGLGARYSHRENAYILSPAKAERFVNLYRQGFDGSSFAGSLLPPGATTGVISGQRRSEVFGAYSFDKPAYAYFQGDNIATWSANKGALQRAIDKKGLRGGHILKVIKDKKWDALIMREADDVDADPSDDGVREVDGAVLTEARRAGKFEVIAIRAGTSKNGNHYSDATLRESVPLFDKVRVFVKSDAEHTTGGGKDFNKLIGRLTEPRFVEGAAPDRGEIRATLELIEPEGPIGTKLAEAYGRGMSHLFGLSIDATAKTATVLREGKKVRVATKFVKVSSVDLIVEPGAGGGLVRVVEAADDLTETTEHDDMKLRERMFEAIKKAAPAKAQAIDINTIGDDELELAYREAVAQPAPAPAAGGNQVDIEARISEAVQVASARAYGTAQLAALQKVLPAKTRERLMREFAANARLTEAAVDEAIKAAREELAQVTESGRVVLPGDVQVEDRTLKMQDMLDAFFDPKHKNHRDVRSFKECYIEITGDRFVTGRLENADRSRMTEAIASTTFGEALGDSITRRMVAEYNAAAYPDIRQVANVVPVMDFRTQRRPRIGGYGDLAAVAEAANYAAVTSPTDEESTYAATKRGGLESISLEAIKNDDVGAIRRVPVKLGRAARRTLCKFVFDFFRTNPTVYDAVAFFHASHNNLFTTALDAAQLSAHRLAMLKQTEISSADRLGIAPRYLLVPPDLQETAVNLFNRNTNNDKTFQQTWNMVVIAVWYWTDVNDWCAVADPNDIPTIEIGFLDGNEEPELFVQDTPSVGSMFTSDQITYKIRHVYGGAVTDFRGATKAVVP